jgi:HD-GYP domain-containing protein (c-di-GMP phosphodiesterase class II)
MAGKTENSSEDRPAKVEKKVRPNHGKNPSQTQKEGLRPIDIKLLGEETTISFPIYGFDGENTDFSLLLQKGGRITEAFLTQVHEKFDDEVYIFAKDWAAYETHTEKAIEILVGDESKSLEERSAAFYEYSTRRLDDAFRKISAEGGKQVGLVQPVAANALDMTRKDWKALFFMLKLARISPRTYTHSLNVCFYGLSYVHNFLPQFAERDIKEIALGFLCHDIGETMLSDQLLNKTTKLTPLERKVMEQVPLYGAEVLKEGQCNYPLTLEIVMYHHERMDGSGYPHGLSKRKIPILARVCGVCEAFDAMTTPRPYRTQVLTPLKALNKMVSEQTNQFDLRVLRNFIKMLGGQVEENVEGKSETLSVVESKKENAGSGGTAVSWVSSLPRVGP